MKTLNIISFLILIFAFGCKKDPPVEPKEPKDKYDPNVIPPLTRTGENTFGCYIDGELFVAGGAKTGWDLPAVSANFDEASKSFGMQGTRYREGLSDNFKIFCKILSGVGTYDYELFGSDDVLAYRNWYGDRCHYYYSLIPNLGKITITYLDDEARIISGTFYMNLVNPDCIDDTLMKITEGRFDVKY